MSSPAQSGGNWTRSRNDNHTSCRRKTLKTFFSALFTTLDKVSHWDPPPASEKQGSEDCRSSFSDLSGLISMSPGSGFNF